MARISVSFLGFHWPKMRYIGLGLGLPILYAVLAYLPYWIVIRNSFNITGYATQATTSLHLQNSVPALLLNVFLLLTSGMIGSTASGLGEEIGWRGFLFPSLLRLSGGTAAIFLSGAIWAFWHYPLILGANYNSGGPAWIGLVCFTWMVIGGAAIFGWLRVKSGSVWPAAIAHGSHNLFIQGICDPITRQDRTAAIWTTEFGILLGLTTTLVALLCWLKYPPRATDAEAFSERAEFIPERSVA
ncbi:MAG TPA: CPBP family intramembrane glutamic endopeptidase [Terriglobales bacterium]|nr:CPBP family intramembrane glutamic endopeptidase [Terriglobales bacterium]